MTYKVGNIYQINGLILKLIYFSKHLDIAKFQVLSKNMTPFTFGECYYFFTKDVAELTEQDKIKIL